MSHTNFYLIYLRSDVLNTSNYWQEVIFRLNLEKAIFKLTQNVHRSTLSFSCIYSVLSHTPNAADIFLFTHFCISISEVLLIHTSCLLHDHTYLILFLSLFLFMNFSFLIMILIAFIILSVAVNYIIIILKKKLTQKSNIKITV